MGPGHLRSLGVWESLGGWDSPEVLSICPTDGPGAGTERARSGGQASGMIHMGGSNTERGQPGPGLFKTP